MNALTFAAPYLHDRWEDELKLEEEMLSLGTERMQSKINKARDKKDMGNLRPYRSLIHEWVIPVSKYLSEWCESQTKKRGVKPIALPLLVDMDHDVVSVCALRSIIRGLGLGSRSIIGLAFEIGTWVEHEARAVAWKEADAEGWNGLEANYADRGANSTHRKRSRIAIFNKYIAQRIEWENWTDEQRRRVGLQMIDCVVQATKRFHVVPDPAWTPPTNAKSAPKNRPLVLEADAEMLDWLARATDDELVHAPVFMPTLIPPKPWEGPRNGGYWTPFVKSPFMIRFRAQHETQRQRAIDDFEALDMPEVYEALNRVQETPWKINRRVYDVAEQVWDMDLGIANFPTKENEEVPSRPLEAEFDEEVRKQWVEEAGDIRTRNATRFSHYISSDRCMKAARRMLNEPLFYFPHMLDFRGRMYPIPSDLSPQGGDLHRGLLTFAKGKVVEPEDACWLAIHLANVHGVDKRNLEKRIEWVEEREAQWRAIAEDPMTYRQWSDEDDAWQCLAAIFEWVGYLDARAKGEAFVSSLPIRVDGTCNGIQHLSAMIRDEIGGKAVNLIPGEAPQDIYMDVAVVLNVLLEEDLEDAEKEEYRLRWVDLLGGKADRSLTKRPVMILPYGGTQHAYMKYTLEWCKENLSKNAFGDKKDKYKMVGFMVTILWKAVSQTIVRPREVMQWLQDCANKASETGMPLYWRTPSGFIVRQFYGEKEMHQIETKIDGQRYQIASWDATTRMDKKAQATGIAPNFVHSMDASALMECVNLAAINGIDSMTTIHDSYGTVSADMWKLYGCIREAFISTHTEPVLEQFLQACKEVAPNVTDWPALPKFGTLNLEDVRRSDYFFH
ncbi:hypothetical protein IB276_22355 [Ensifer sp. ENS04]|uniref:DNA-directed RNA polymerase n=1 Tax=Ensifer sp. ENS04 TaxID=2769281 RepID=UPI0017832901|nr:DNA-directed RNA polymerase [Ensifer sp. ENS04]MBD9542190.1 hypothetical protein [Ensifer sp. ENS04]